MNILVIGGEGYIGRELIKYLYKKLDSDSLIKSLDLNLYQQDKYLKRLSFKNYEFFIGNMGNKKILKKCLKNIDSVILLAGLVGDPITKKYPAESIEIIESFEPSEKAIENTMQEPWFKEAQVDKRKLN